MRARLATVALALSLIPFAAAPVAAAENDLLPDLQMEIPYNLQIQRAGSDGKKLRFGTIVWNVGDGPLEVRAGNRVDREMLDLEQFIRTRGGSGRSDPRPGATAFYSGDGHDHWHIRSFVVVSLFPSPATTAGDTLDSATAERRLKKIGFCLTDLVRAPADLRPSNSASRIAFPVSGCGTIRSDTIRIGISVGYGDDYKPYFNQQSIDLTGLAPATYRLCATANANGMWLEKNDNLANNSSWVDVELDVERNRLRVVDQGQGDCERPSAVFFGFGA